MLKNPVSALLIASLLFFMVGCTSSQTMIGNLSKGEYRLMGVHTKDGSPYRRSQWKRYPTTGIVGTRPVKDIRWGNRTNKIHLDPFSWHHSYDKSHSTETVKVQKSDSGKTIKAIGIDLSAILVGIRLVRFADIYGGEVEIRLFRVPL